MEELELRMRQNTKPGWVYEWPMKKTKVKWPVKQLMVIRQCRLLRKWLRYAENLKTTEEEMVHVCEPETGDILSEENEMRSSEDLKNYQVSKATQEEKDDEHSEEWLNIFSQEAENTATWEFAEEEEEADNINLADLYEHIEALEERVKVQSMHIQQVNLEAKEEGMGDHDDLPMCQ
jgi:hypothetical protein